MQETKIATRQSYGEALVKLGKENLDVVVLDADLSSATKTKLFADAFPEGFFNVGIAEQDLMGTAAGLSTFGKIPFAAYVIRILLICEILQCVFSHSITARSYLFRLYCHG